MAPTADTVALPLTAPAALPRTSREGSRWFYARMAYAFAFIAIAGFTPTYWAPLATRSFDGPPILHLHGLLFTAWTLLFVVQARLAAAGRLERHRMLGFAGISIATAMLFAGIAVSIHSIEGGIARGFGDQARAFSIVPITIILTFAALVAAAIANVRRPEVHMRLMLVASVALLPPAIARVLRLLLAPAGTLRPGLGEPPTVAFALVPNLLADLLLVVAIVHDWRTRGRPHPAYLIAGAGLLAVQVLRTPLSGTAAWHSVTNWLLTIGG